MYSNIIGPPLSDSFKEYYNFSEKDAEDAIYVFREYYDVEGWKDNAPFAGVEEMLKSLKLSESGGPTNGFKTFRSSTWIP